MENKKVKNCPPPKWRDKSKYLYLYYCIVAIHYFLQQS